MNAYVSLLSIIIVVIINNGKSETQELISC